MTGTALDRDVTCLGRFAMWTMSTKKDHEGVVCIETNLVWVGHKLGVPVALGVS